MMEKRTTSFKLAFFAFFLQTNRRSHRSQWVLHYCYSAVFHVSYLLLWCPQTDEKKESIHNCDFKKKHTRWDMTETFWKPNVILTAPGY